MCFARCSIHVWMPAKKLIEPASHVKRQVLIAYSTNSGVLKADGREERRGEHSLVITHSSSLVSADLNPDLTV